MKKLSEGLTRDIMGPAWDTKQVLGVSSLVEVTLLLYWKVSFTAFFQATSAFGLSPFPKQATSPFS